MPLNIPTMTNAAGAARTFATGKASETADKTHAARGALKNQRMTGDSELTTLASRQQALFTTDSGNRQSFAVNEFGQEAFRHQSLQVQRHTVEAQNLAALRSFAEGTAKLAASGASKVAESVK